MEKNEPTTNGRLPIMFIPGGISPAAITYDPLLEVLKDLEFYAADRLPGYELKWEIEGIRCAAEAAGLKSFHLIEYSGGLSLAFTARYPEWVRSLALIEPGWIADDTWRREEAAYWSELGRVMALPPEERLHMGIALNVRPRRASSITATRSATALDSQASCKWRSNVPGLQRLQP